MPRLEGAFIRHLEDGKRSPEKLHRNLELLLKEEQANPNNARTKFYIANTFFDMGKYLEAMGYYLRRMEMPDWEQEAFYAQYRYAICQERLGNAVSIIAHWSAWDYRPSRIEPLVALARLYRARNEFNAAYMVTGIAVKTPMTTDSLFVDAQAWEWDAPLEHGIACLATGRNKEAVETLALLVGKPGPEHLRQGAVANLRVALSKLT
jgi:tetratricopeptide (TPR) repeat protein